MTEYTDLSFWTERGMGNTRFLRALDERSAGAALHEIDALLRYLLARDALPVLKRLLTEFDAGHKDTLRSLEAAEAAKSAAVKRSKDLEDRYSVEIHEARQERGLWPPEVVEADKALRHADFLLGQAQEAGKQAISQRGELLGAIRECESLPRPSLPVIAKLQEALA